MHHAGLQPDRRGRRSAGEAGQVRLEGREVGAQPGDHHQHPRPHPHRYGGLQIGAAGVRHGRWSTGALYSDRRGYAGRTEAAGREVCHMGVELRLLTPL